ncbi:hypothetical protein ACNVED_17065 (plasmid) [Legionella sp. D16C41]|uniref:Abi-like protein n=1 Tax=Legionella beliardensis TaxID=91822 RepID=A0A378JQN0_9GAMM|nr:hypothetical protein [Legionella beliardensis]STX55496.1 Abi-like protein [Legionella beliardensis]
MQEQNELLDELLIIFSKQRFEGYLTKSLNTTEALVNYSWNIELCQGLYPFIQILEIALRNSLHQSITVLFDREDWFELDFLGEWEKEQVKQAKKTLSKNKKPIEPGRVVAELSFGFWTALLDVRYEHSQILWPKLFKTRLFPFLKRSQRTRHFLSKEFTQVRRLRNRIFHYEPIWYWHDLLNRYEQIIFLINAISNKAANYLRLFEDFEYIHGNGRNSLQQKIVRVIENNHKE